MNARKMQQSGLTVFLHFYTDRVYIRKNFVFYPGERHEIFLTAESLKTAFPLVVVVKKEKELWRLNERTICQENICILKTEAEEEIMAVISERKKRLMPCEKLVLPNKMEIRIGKDYKNEIFYDSFTFIRDCHMQIFQTEEGAVIEGVTKEEGSNAGIYINGKVLEGRVLLMPGDEIALLGLSLIYLPGWIVAASYYGTLRTAIRKECLPVIAEGKKEAVPWAGTIRQGTAPDGEIVTKEIEILLPEKEGRLSNQSLFLTLGPSATMVIPMLLMAMLGSAMMGQSGAGYYRMSVVMTAASAFLSVFWGIINHICQKKISRKEETKRKEAYREYLHQTEQRLQADYYGNKQALIEKYPPGQSFFPTATKNGQIFWNGNIRQRDYLFIRLGLGDIPFQVKIKISHGRKELIRDLLEQEALDIADRYRILTSVPVGIDLRQQKITGFAGERIYPVFLQALLQLAVHHQGRDVKLIYFYHEDVEKEKKIADCIKWIPHIWENGRKMRFLAGNEKEAGEILPELAKKLVENTGQESAEEAYIFLLAAKELIRGEELYHFLLKDQKDREVYILFLEKDKEKLPGECSCQVIKEKNREEIIYYEQETLKRQRVIFEESSFTETENFMRQLAQFSVKESGQEELPGEVSFLDLFSCRRVEDLNCRGRWRENQTENRIRVPIGMGKGRRIIYLDVHEKFHGPHGLIAGTTGAGKSELLQTYLLSLAVSFGPEDINFFIIDYKGGGMGDILCRLPHCSGVISNLSGRQIQRALVSIKSENERRQRLFHKAGVNHISDYTALYKSERISDPIPHLLLVVDEFAELKKEEPEFMQEIISLAQVGRSLGVHLLLSTQKPAGTIDDKIWSNTRFKLCLRVADKQDSMDMLHRPDAAYLTGAGQCYLQVGNNELYEIFQTGYGGEEYEENEFQRKENCMVSGTGRRFSRSIEKRKACVTQTEAVIHYINNISGQLGCKMADPLWMPELPDKLLLADIEEKCKEDGEVSMCLGICDDPGRQMQYPLFYHPLEEGHICLCGAPAVGKSTFLQTMLWQLCRYPKEQVRFMLAGSESAGVNCFETMPGCLGNMKKKEDAECFFFHVERTFAKREAKLQGIHFRQYRKHHKDDGAFLFLIIDNYGNFRQMTEDRYEGLIEKIAAKGPGYGFYLMITAFNAGAGELPAKLFEKIKLTLAMEMSDRFQYGDVLRRYQSGVFPKENVKGRGICKSGDRILEFQVPLFSLNGDDYDRIDKITTAAKQQMDNLPKQEEEEKFPWIPDKPVFNTMYKEFIKDKENRSCIPLGYEEKSGYILGLPIEKTFSFLISGAQGTGKRNFLFCLMRSLWEKKVETVIVDQRQDIWQSVQREAGTEEKKYIRFLLNEMEFVQWYDGLTENKQSCLCICNLNDFSKMLQTRKEEMIRIKEKMQQDAESGSMMSVIALCEPGKEMELGGNCIYELLLKHQWGVHLGGNAANQRMLSFEDMPYVQMMQWEKPGTGYLKRGTGRKTEKIRAAYYEKAKKEAEDDIGGHTGSGNQSDL